MGMWWDWVSGSTAALIDPGPCRPSSAPASSPHHRVTLPFQGEVLAADLGKSPLQSLNASTGSIWRIGRADEGWTRTFS